MALSKRQSHQMLGQDRIIMQHQTCISNDSTIDSQEPKDSIFHTLLFFSLLLSFLLLSISIWLMTDEDGSKKMAVLGIFWFCFFCSHFFIQTLLGDWVIRFLAHGTAKYQMALIMGCMGFLSHSVSKRACGWRPRCAGRFQWHRSTCRVSFPGSILGSLRQGKDY